MTKAQEIEYMQGIFARKMTRYLNVPTESWVLYLSFIESIWDEALRIERQSETALREFLAKDKA